MDEAEKKRLEELFTKKNTNDVEAVETAKECLDACLAHLGAKTEFILFVKAPHDPDTIYIHRCACMAFTMSAAIRLNDITSLPAALLNAAMNRKPGPLARIFNLFKRGDK